MDKRCFSLLLAVLGLVGELATAQSQPRRIVVYVQDIDSDLGGCLQGLGNLIQHSEENKLIAASRCKKAAGPSEIDHAVVMFFDFELSQLAVSVPKAAPGVQLQSTHVAQVRAFALSLQSTSLQPAGIPTAAGSGTDISDDGRCAIGYQDAGFFTPYHAFRWTAAGGPVDLGTLVPASNATLSSFASATSADCSVVVGFSDMPGGFIQHGFRWTQAGGMVDLVPPGGAGRSSRALDISSDGSTIVGDAEFVGGFSGFQNKAFRWTAGGGFASLGDLQANYPSVATAVSSDGSVIVGQASLAAGLSTISRAFRWTQAGGMVGIGTLPGYTHAAATAVSGDGQIVFGITSANGLTRSNLGYNFGTDTRAFRWTQATGMQSLKDLLVADGADVAGVEFVDITAVSADGQWIAGRAARPATHPGETVPFFLQYCDPPATAVCTEVSAAGPGVTLSYTNLAFGPVTLGATGTAATPLTITNSGASPLSISAIAFTGADAAQFTQTNTCGTLPAALAPNASCLVTPGFAPTSVGAKSASLVLTTDAAGSAPSVALTGTGADFSIVASAGSSLSVSAGQTATLPLTLATSGAALTGAVTFSASGGPRGTTVSFAPASFAAGTNGGTTTISIATTSRVAHLLTPTTGLMLAVGLLLALPATRGRSTARRIAMASTLLMLAGCGGGGDEGGGDDTNPNGTPAGTYTITVTATSGSLVRTTQITLVVT